MMRGIETVARLFLAGRMAPRDNQCVVAFNEEDFLCLNLRTVSKL